MIELLTVFWVLDILDLPFMQMFDTTYPINGNAWFWIWFTLLIMTGGAGDE